MMASGSGLNGVSGVREYIRVRGMNVCATDRLYKSASSYKGEEKKCAMGDSFNNGSNKKTWDRKKLNLIGLRTIYLIHS